LPFAPRWSAPAIATIACAWPTSPLDRDTGRGLVLQALEVGAMLLVARFAFRAKTRAGAGIGMAVGAAAVSVATQVAFAAAFVDQINRSVLAPLPLDSLGVLVVVALAVFWRALLVLVVFPYLRANTHEASDQAVAIAALGVLLPNSQWALWSRIHVFGAPAIASSGVGFALAGALFCVALARVYARRRWLSAARDRGRPGFRILSTAGSDRSLPCLATRRDAPEVHDLVVVREVESPMTYRDGAPVPVARIARGRPRSLVWSVALLVAGLGLSWFTAVGSVVTRPLSLVASFDFPGDCHTSLAMTTSCHGEDTSFQECHYHFRADGEPDPRICQAFLNGFPAAAPHTPSTLEEPSYDECRPSSPAGWSPANCADYGVDGTMRCFRCRQRRGDVSVEETVQAFDATCARGVVLVGCNEPPW
jgi:hypothetical protein